ncbi:MAG: aminopeptidase [Xanthomonadales bacterium]|nr:aminopeptidase [Xanthomonadales bacterium]
MAVALLYLAACASPSYYSQAISGHRDLMRQRKDIAEILDSGSASPELTHQLKLAVEIRQFAVTRLQLPDNASYTQFVETGRDAVTWNVVAAPEFSLSPRRWCFLVSGCVPYRGYFKLQNAQDFAAKLHRAGDDTAVSPVIAYSTLGWFDDPLLDTMFQYSDEQLAAFIFHELAHQELYVSGDTTFNESYASFIEETGVRLWLESSGREKQLPGWLKLQSTGPQFNALLQETQKKLEAIYTSGLPEESMRKAKSTVFEDLRVSYGLMVEEQWEGRSYFASLFSRELNNASLALVNSYRGGSCAFEKLYREAGRDMARFQNLAASRAKMGKEQRQAWLGQPCEVIAPGGNL